MNSNITRTSAVLILAAPELLKACRALVEVDDLTNVLLMSNNEIEANCNKRNTALALIRAIIEAVDNKVFFGERREP